MLHNYDYNFNTKEKKTSLEEGRGFQICFVISKSITDEIPHDTTVRYDFEFILMTAWKTRTVTMLMIKLSVKR